MSQLRLFSIVALFLLVGCMGSAKLSGTSAESFKDSKAKVESQLSASDKIKLEKALSVVMTYTIRQKWNHPEKYEGKNWNDISLNIVNNKTFSELVNFAETCLKQQNNEEKKQTKEEIETLKKQKQNTFVIIKKLDQIKATNIKIVQEDSLGEKTLFIDVTFTNQSDKEMVGDVMYQLDVYSKSTGQRVASNGAGGTFKEGFSIKPNETDNVQIVLQEDAQNLSSLWKTAKYPVTDFAKFGLIIQAYPTEITFKGEGKIERPKENLSSLENHINKLENKLKTLDSVKGTLDELEDK